jgi:hypothetical protein
MVNEHALMGVIIEVRVRHDGFLSHADDQFGFEMRREPDPRVRG